MAIDKTSKEVKGFRENSKEKKGASHSKKRETC